MRSLVRTWRLVPAGIIFKLVVAAVVEGVATRARDAACSAQATSVTMDTVVRHTIPSFFISTPPTIGVQSGDQLWRRTQLSCGLRVTRRTAARGRIRTD